MGQVRSGGQENFGARGRGAGGPYLTRWTNLPELLFLFTRFPDYTLIDSRVEAGDEETTPQRVPQVGPCDVADRKMKVE